MLVLRLFLLFLLVLLLRRLYRQVKAIVGRSTAARRRDTRDDKPTSVKRSNWTQQDISDADYEEIP